MNYEYTDYVNSLYIRKPGKALNLSVFVYIEVHEKGENHYL